MNKKKQLEPNPEPEDTSSRSKAYKKKRKEELFIFGESCGHIDKDLVKRHLAYLVALAVLVNIVVLFATTSVFHSFIDYYDFQYYLQAMINIMHGQLPYADFSFDYPPLALFPMIVAFVPATLLQNGLVFVYSFQFLMVLCDIITVVCIYLVGLRLYPEKTAFVAAVLFATAFSVAYFVLTKYDAFPTCILMLAVLFTVYNKSIRGYIAIILGVLAKIFPVIALPFVALYNAKETSLKQEIIAILKIGIPVAVICLVPVLLIKPGIILSYFSVSLVRSSVYVNAATYTLYAYLHDILHLGIDTATVSVFMYVLMALVFFFLIAIAYVEPKKNARFLIKLLAIAIFVVVFCMKYHSPQYVVWFAPFVCLLVADSLYGIVLFYVTQVITYIEFPLVFGSLYINGSYVGETGTPLWYMALLFFTVNFAAYLLLMYMAVKPTGSHARILLGRIQELLSKKA